MDKLLKKSFKLFFCSSIKTLYAWLAFVFGLLSFISPFIEIPLPTKYQGVNMPLAVVFMTIAWLLVILAAFHAYYKLVKKSVKDVYDAFPETKKGIVFRELFVLYKWGELEKKTCEDRQRRWDDEVIILLNKHFSDQCKKNYLLDSGRRLVDLNNIAPLEFSKFDAALYYIKDLLERNFDTYFKA